MLFALARACICASDHSQLASARATQERTAVVDRVARLVLENRLAAMRLHALTRAAPEAEALAADAAVIAPLLGALSEWGADATLSPETRALVASLSAEVAAAQQRQESAGGARGAGGCDEDASATAAEESENAAPASGANRWISEADFSALPASVRGRCSLATVTRALELVCKHFANCGERYPTPLSLKALSAMGAKATGATGANVISSLRALKLVSVSKEGLLLTSEGWRLARA
jgi:hypothetical protein